MITEIRAAVHSRSHIQSVPGWVIPAVARPLGLALRDVLLTGDEYRAMAAGLADTDGPATGTTRFSEWLADNAPLLGRSYANELNRHFREAERVR